MFDNLERGHMDLDYGTAFVRGDLRKLDHAQAVFREYPIEGVVHFVASSLFGQTLGLPSPSVW
ncbi:MAG: hypothetical protein CSA35_05830 [Dethiosulfovibrio peptidovorans]|nr:MAG: hypothetical protein CSA35_05830 [Dethiosulfovibrio peptidovorans]